MSLLMSLTPFKTRLNSINSDVFIKLVLCPAVLLWVALKAYQGVYAFSSVS